MKQCQKIYNKIVSELNGAVVKTQEARRSTLTELVSEKLEL